MYEGPAKRVLDMERLVSELQERVENERVAGAYADDLSDIKLQALPHTENAPAPIAAGFDLGGRESRVQFRPELGFSSKPVIGPVITAVKRFILRLRFYVFDDLARQADAAIARVEAALAVEIAARERLESEMERKTRKLEAQIRLLETQSRSETNPR